MDIIDFIFKLVANQYTPLVFCGIIIAAFIWGAYLTFKATKAVKRLLNNANEIIESSSEGISKSDFYLQFDTVNRKLHEIESLKPVWEEFEESTFRDHESKQICLSRRPSQYFQPLSLLNTKCNIKQVKAFPNYLIGIGLFFTFLGLSAALHVAQSGLQSASGSQDALKELLAVASVKFISSLVAIFLSLVLSYIQRYAINSCNKALYKFCHLIEQRTEFRPAEKLLIESLLESKKQTSLQSNMALNIAEKLEGILSKSLPDSVAKALEPLAGEIHNLAKKFSGSNEDALQQVLQEFLQQLRQSAGQDMDALVSSVQTLKIGLDKLVDNLQGLSSNFGQETKDSTARLASFLEKFTQTFEPVQKGLGQFGEALITLEAVSEKIANAGGSITGAADTNKIAIEGFVSAMSVISAQIEPIKEALIDMRSSMQVISSTAHKIESAGENMKVAAGELRQSADSMSISQSNMNHGMQNFTQAASNVSNSALNLEQASRQMAEAIPSLKTASNEVTGLASVMSKTEQRIGDSYTQLNEMAVSINRTVENIPAILQSYEQRFGKVDKELEAAFTQLTNGASEFQNSVKGFVNELGSKFEGALNSLSGVVQDLAEEREEAFENKRNSA